VLSEAKPARKADNRETEGNPSHSVGVWDLKSKLGFGCMRLPLFDGEVDKEQFSAMIDACMTAGFNYFDTAHGYLDGKSEKAIKDCLVSRYPRESFILTDKLTNDFFKKEGGVRPLFETQLKACGTTYFDWYLMHSQNSILYAKFKKCRCFETALALKEEGKIKHIGISFHDRAEVLDLILSEQQSIEAVQIQLNYLDYDDAAIQSRLCLDICRKYNKKVFVMEPIKGGRLVDLPPRAQGIADNAGVRPSDLALRFAAGLDGVEYVLSGMSNLDQVKENIAVFSDLKSLTDKEKQAVDEIVDVIRSENLIQCTSCRYCTAGCPQKIAIPDVFACFNAKKRYGGQHYDYYYNFVHTVENGKASSCIGCGKCEQVCPQHLKIRDYLKSVAEVFESK